VSTVAHVLLDEMSEVVEVDHHLLDAAGAEEREDVLEERTTADRDERLRRGVGQGSEPRPAPGPEHHRTPDHAASSGV
jgi:hypothetical protein